MSDMKHVAAIMAALVIGVLTGVAPAADAPANVPGPAQGAYALKADLAAKLPAMVTASVDPSQQTAARDALNAIVAAIQQSLLAQADSKELEVRSRAREIQANMLEAVRLRKVLSTLSPTRRKAVLDLCNTNRAGYNTLFASQSLNAMYGSYGVGLPVLETVTEQEPLLIVCLRFGSQPTVRVAAEIVRNCDFKSPELVDALTYAVVSPIQCEVYPALPMMYNPQMNDPWHTCVAALESIGNKQAATVLLAALLQPKAMTINSHAANASLSGVVSALGDKSLLPPIMERLQKAMAEQPQTMPVTGTDAIIKPYDGLIDCASRLAGLGQPMARVTLKNQAQQIFVFKSEQDREDAVKRLLDWWDKNKALSPATQPAKVPDLAMWLRQSHIAPATAPAAAPKFDAAQAGHLAARAKQVGQSLVEELGSERVARREAAQQALMDLYVQYLDVLADASSSDLARMAIDRAVTDAFFQSHQTDISPELREQLTKAGRLIPGIIDDLFCFERVRTLSAVRSLSKLDKKELQQVGEPLLVYCVNHSSPDVSMAACEVAAGGLYKSDDLVEALGNVLIAVNVNYFNWSAIVYQQGQRFPAPLALNALKVIRTPKAAATILAGMKIGQQHDQYRGIAFCWALTEMGEKSVVPALVEGIDGRMSGSIGWPSGNGKQMTITDRDGYLSTAIVLTGQKPDDYGMVFSDRLNGQMDTPKVWGFEKESDRTAAVQKFKQWWQDNKDKAPYKDLAPLPAVKFKKVPNPNGYGMYMD